MRPEKSGCGPLGAVGQSVGRVLDIATGENLAIFGQKCRTYAEFRVGCVSVSSSLGRTLKEFSGVHSQEDGHACPSASQATQESGVINFVASSAIFIISSKLDCLSAEVVASPVRM